MNKIALTFDDGPNPHATPKILDILDALKVKGSFFVIGKRCLEHPKTLAEIKTRGHLIGNHTFSHKIGDFEKCDEVLNEILNEKSQYVRPPFYDFSFCEKESDYLTSKIIVTGDIDSKDYLDISPDQVFRNSTLAAKNGSIIDFHDGSENQSELQSRAQKTIEALPKIIAALTKRGFVFCTVAEIDTPNAFITTLR